MNKKEEEFLEFLEFLKKEYSKSLTELSKTNKENFIDDNTLMISGDDLAEKYKPDKGFTWSSVDAIYFTTRNDKLTLYFFEFKKIYPEAEEMFYPERMLKKHLKKQESCEHKEELEKLPKLTGKIKNSLKIKPLGSLIILYTAYKEYCKHSTKHSKEYSNHSREVISSITKKYCVVLDEKSQNMVHIREKRKFNSYELDFKKKLSPYPFCKTESFVKTQFSNLLEKIKEN